MEIEEEGMNSKIRGGGHKIKGKKRLFHYSSPLASLAWKSLLHILTFGAFTDLFGVTFVLVSFLAYSNLPRFGFCSDVVLASWILI